MILDGGLATTLQRVGLPVYSPVEPWIDAHPERIREAHRAFAEAGAQIVCTATFRAHTRPDGARLAAAAVELARSAGVAVWGAFGPAMDREALDRLPELVRVMDVDGFVLETAVDVDDLVAMVRAVRGASDRPIAATVVPRIFENPRAGLIRAIDAGADVVGLNCAPVEHIGEALAEIRDIGPVWVKPSGDRAPEQLATAIRAWAADYAGACCGGGPEHVRAIGRTTR